MKIAILISAFLATTTAFAAPAKTCVDLTGKYLWPSTVEDEISGLKNYLTINQKDCLGWIYFVGTEHMVPITPPWVFGKARDGVMFSIAGQTIVVQSTDGEDLRLTSFKHGECNTKRFTMALDSNRDLVITASSIYNCKDKYRGSATEVFKRQ